MTDVNVMNAVMRERARIREEIIRISNSQKLTFVDGNGDVFIKRGEVLAVIDPKNETN